MKTNSISWLSVMTLGLMIAGSAAAQTPPPVKVDSETISGLGARNIGSAAMSGRITSVAAVKEGQRLTVYAGAASGGVWKSVNGGTTFKPVFDKESVQSIGAITIDPKNAKTIWVGTGEPWTRNSTSVGDGVYKSTDGGDNWTQKNIALSSVGLSPSSFYLQGIGFVSPDEGWIGGTSGIPYPSSFLHTTDGGVTWSGSGYNDTYRINRIRFLDSGFGIAAGERLHLFRR